MNKLLDILKNCYTAKIYRENPYIYWYIKLLDINHSDFYEMKRLLEEWQYSTMGKVSLHAVDIDSIPRTPKNPLST